MDASTGNRDVVGRGLSAAREVLDQLRPYADERTVRRAEGGDLRADVLAVLAEEPSNGYRIVRVLAERGGDAPTAGAVYPELQLLADEGLATAEEVDGRKVWTLTNAGRAAAEAPRSRAGRDEPAARGADLRGAIIRSGAQLTQATALAAQVARKDQIAEVVAVLDDARRRVLAILARS